MKKLAAIGVSSVFKMSLVLGAVAGTLVGVILMVVSFTEKRFMEGIITLVLAPLLYGGVGALVNALMAYIYNMVAARLGGIEISLED